MKILEREKRRRPALSGHDVDLSWAHAAESLFGECPDLRFGDGAARLCNLSGVIKKYLQASEGESRILVLLQSHCKVVQTWKEPLEGPQDARLQKVPQMQKPPALAPHQGLAYCLLPVLQQSLWGGCFVRFHIKTPDLNDLQIGSFHFYNITVETLLTRNDRFSRVFIDPYFIKR